jgi:radical SAM protein
VSPATARLPSLAARAAREARDLRLARLDFDQAPFTIAWEVTRSCAYACLHCRADAQPQRDPGELTTDEGRGLIDRLAAFGTRPILVLTGGDPLMRRDLFELAAHADERGLRVSLTPTATALANRRRMRLARASGIKRVAFSVDGASARTHDRFRGFKGSFGRTMRAMADADAAGLALQVNTTVCRPNRGELERMASALARWGVVQWSVFFLVPTGRGATLPMLSAAEHEQTLEWLADASARLPFDTKATAAPQYRRILAQRRARRAATKPEDAGSGALAGAGFRFADGLDRPSKGVNDGRGFMFVSHRGELTPSGFLPISAGNVRERDPVRLYRESPLFRELRDPDALKGKCGRCEFREVCGGSRARAFALTGDQMAADPSCPYIPNR